MPEARSPDTRRRLARRSACAILLLAARAACAVPSLEETPGELRVEAPGYRAVFQRNSSDFSIELRGRGGRWVSFVREFERPEFGLAGAAGAAGIAGARVEQRHRPGDRCITIGRRIVMGGSSPVSIQTHFLCADEGILIRFALDGGAADAVSTCWALPRLPLDATAVGRYAYWNQDDAWRAGPIAALPERNGYAGVSAWGREGDTADRLSARHPALIAGAEAEGAGVAAVFLRYETDWAGAHAFLQRHTPGSLFFYPGIAPAGAARKGLWAWLAPMPAHDAAAAAARVEALLALGETLAGAFKPVAPAPDPRLLVPVPDFPAGLRRDRPVDDIRDAIVYTINQDFHPERGFDAVRKAGSDVLIRAWFKWRNATDWAKHAPLVPRAHGLGALFGGGVTCSALYDGENGLPPERVLDMATRGPDGALVDAWGEPGIRHGSLSNPAYIEYVLSWCRQQIDAGADYLFMDEINAALQHDEGFDDHSIREFREHLLRQARGGGPWAPGDPRWREVFKIDLGDPAVCPDGTLGSFQYRAYLQKLGFVAKPHAAENPLAAEWLAFRDARDDRAWKAMCDAMRAHAAAQGRRVLISGNGLARYVDLQVLGIWGNWKAGGGVIDLSENQVDEWSGTVAAGRALAGAPVPVVFFHDWGFGGFPWMNDVPPAQRELWMRVRGAEIYASGAFFAFPVSGPWGNDALVDGTIGEIARQARFYRRNRGLYLDARFAGSEPLEADAPLLSLALWRRENPPALFLHAVNRDAKDARPVPRRDIRVRIPADAAPKCVRIVSPDWEGERPGEARMEGGRLCVTLPEVDAYAVALLDYAALPEVRMRRPRIRPQSAWAPQGAAAIDVTPDGSIAGGLWPAGFLHGDYHAHLRRPPVFRVHMPRGGRLNVCVRAVATQGARLECRIDDGPPAASDFPDLDGKNDAEAPEYDRVAAFDIPPGRHRVALANAGGDWARIAWYAFEGDIAPW